MISVYKEQCTLLCVILEIIDGLHRVRFVYVFSVRKFLRPTMLLIIRPAKCYCIFLTLVVRFRLLFAALRISTLSSYSVHATLSVVIKTRLHCFYRLL